MQFKVLYIKRRQLLVGRNKHFKEVTLGSAKL